MKAAVTMGFRSIRGQRTLWATVALAICAGIYILWVAPTTVSRPAATTMLASAGTAERSRSGEAPKRPQQATHGPEPHNPEPPSPSAPPDPEISRPAGPKFSEPRVAFAGPDTLSADGDPGPGTYLKAYQGRSGRLSSHALPHIDDSPDRNSSVGEAPKLVVWAASTRVFAGEPVIINGSLLDDSGQLVEPETMEIHLSTAHEDRPAAFAAMTPAPAGGPSQFIYTHQTATHADVPGGKGTPPAEYRFVVRTRGKLGGLEFERTAGGFFLVQSAGAKLDRAATTVDLRRGNLELDLLLRVERVGTYFVSAELWGGPTGTLPIAFARERLEELTPGARPITLLFGGKIIHDSGIDGPYVVRNVRLMQVDAVPPHEAEPIDALPSTRAMVANDFY